MDNLRLFEAKKIRTHWDDEQQLWFFSVQDVVEALTDSLDIKQYIKKLKSRDPELYANWGTICTLVEMIAADGKKRKIQAANTQGILRIIQSIPSPKAEPFKQWLAQVGYERLEEDENPELSFDLLPLKFRKRRNHRQLIRIKRLHCKGELLREIQEKPSKRKRVDKSLPVRMLKRKSRENATSKS